ncbi:hypothetical protein WICPIJ_008332 [Wickerhamomyces pijperi]|uniref:Uncharacterized protein n=1 Tax=Wickerhamomyces pijperi TaxID=599730 RepID=A0A9P8PZ99_WICPI|nr:hypothetical protein WICPIJ_008332 [Wickerhamomyces pijperi]
MIRKRTYSTLIKHQHQLFKGSLNNKPNNNNMDNFKKGLACFMIGYGVSFLMIKLNNLQNNGLNDKDSAVGSLWDSGELEPKYRDSLYWAGF